MILRMRQICLVAKQLRPVVADFKAVFDLNICHVDPYVGRWGLENVLMPVGNGFLEVVAPVKDGTAAGRYLDRRKGDGGYMVIMQTSAEWLAEARRRVDKMGIPIVGGRDYGDYQGIQLHPYHTGGAIMSINWSSGDQDDPRGAWHPAGDQWTGMVPSSLVLAMRAAELQADNPLVLATRWSQILDLPLLRDRHGQLMIHLDDAELRFVTISDDRGEGLSTIDLSVIDRDEVIERAETRGLRVREDTVTICGTRFRLV